MTSAATTEAARPTQRVLDALTDHGPLENGKPWDGPLTAEQRDRALRAGKEKAGLRGKALASWVLTGDAVAPKAKTKAPREGTAMHAALAVLKDASTPLTPQEIYDRAKKRGLATALKGKTPVASLAAQLAVANKNGLHVERPAPGRYQLRA